MKLYKLTFLILILLFFSCERKVVDQADNLLIDSLNVEKKEVEKKEILREITRDDLVLIKGLEFNKYTLDDEYPYRDTTRIFQWEKIKERLAFLENTQKEKYRWAILSNYKNNNKESPLVYDFVRNAYKRVSDTLGVERYQSAPLFLPGDTIQPIRYGRDGWLVHIQSSDTLDMVRVKGVSFEGEYDVPKRYIIPWGDTIVLKKAVFVDVTNQNIASVEKMDSAWIIRSMNPCTTGRHKPPYAQETPVGLYAVQEKKKKMFYTHDGSSELAGYAPYASRFTNGAYIHGVPTNSVDAAIIEYSWSLGTIPRSHMCVRNASSHAKYVYEWGLIKETVIFVID